MAVKGNMKIIERGRGGILTLLAAKKIIATA
jgi:hypothetical protein